MRFIPSNDHFHRGRHRSEQRAGRWLVWWAQCVLALVLIGLPLFWGGRHPLGTGLAGAGVVFAFVLAVTGILLKGRVRFQPAPAVIPLLVVLLIGALQLSPEFSAWAMTPELRAVWERAAASGLFDGVPLLASMPEFQVRVLALLAVAALACWLMAQLFSKDCEHLVALSLVVTLAAFVAGLCGFWQRFGDEEWVLWVYQGPVKVMTGTYWNRNHFAQLEAMGFFTALGLVTALVTARHGSWLAQAFGKRTRIALSVLLGVAALTAALGIVFSSSRTGTLMAAAGLAIFIFYTICVRRASAVSTPAVLVFLIVLIAGFYGLDELMARVDLALSGEDVSGLSRFEMWKTALQVIQLSPLWGSGFGGMRALSNTFDLSYIPGWVTFDVHNDYIDLVLMLGAPAAGGILLFALVKLVCVIVELARRRARHSSLHALAVGVLLGLLAAAGHEVMDYGLKQPANLLIFLALTVVLGGLVRYFRSGEAADQAPVQVAQAAPAAVVAEASAQQSVAVSSHHHHHHHAHGEESPRTKRDAWSLGRALYVIPALCMAAAVPVEGYFADQMTEGRALADLQAVLQAPEIRVAMGSDTWLQAIQRRARVVLVENPHRVEALDAMANATLQQARQTENQVLARSVARILEREVSVAQLWRAPYQPYWRAAFERLSNAERRQVAAAYREAGEALAALARAYPMNGVALSQAANAMDESAAWARRAEVQTRWHAAAIGITPSHTEVLLNTMRGLWRTLQMTTDAAERARLTAELIRHARFFSWQAPYRMDKVYPLIWEAQPDFALMRELASDTVGGQESLAQFLALKGDLNGALAAYEAMARLNDARPEEETPETLGNVGFMRRDRRAKPVLARIILERELTIWKRLGDVEKEAQALEKIQQMLANERIPRLARADELIEQGDSVLADEILKNLKGDMRALVRRASIAYMQGRLEFFARSLRGLRDSAEPLDADTVQRFEVLKERAAARGIRWETEPES